MVFNRVIFESDLARAFVVEYSLDDFGVTLDVFMNASDGSSSFPETLEHFYIEVPPVQFDVGYDVLESEAFWVSGLRRGVLDLVHDQKLSFHGFVECHPGDQSSFDESSLVDDLSDRSFLEDDSLLASFLRSFLNYTNPGIFVPENDLEEKVAVVISFLREIAQTMSDRYRTDVCAFGLWHPLLKFLGAQIMHRQGHLEIFGRDRSFFSHLLGLEHNLDLYYNARNDHSRRRLGSYEESYCDADDADAADDDGDGVAMVTIQ